ncbi:MAG: methylated-DNA--[protein]-cysteine S-methyltransferase [Chloroflexi bacterium]|nr:methylated-DNA--[protein]-cysteine S-methyltransferase [Chloroflexota bacterium]
MNGEIERWLGDAPGKPERDAVMSALDALYRNGPTREAAREAQARLKQTFANLKPRVVWYDWIDGSSVGRVFFAASTTGLVAVDFGVSERTFLSHVRAQTGAEAKRAPDRLGAIAKQLREYFAGRRTTFDIPLDLRLMRDFQRRVLLAALEIPHGQVTTYHEIARRIGRPKASRAVGQALGHNPMPIVIPCHRVLGSDGSLHGYGAGQGIKTKAWLLKLEGAKLA